jgi:hypothetical protein
MRPGVAKRLVAVTWRHQARKDLGRDFVHRISGSALWLMHKINSQSQATDRLDTLRNQFVH